jgi:lipopolysaccharide/colanic/teichoic acid biosynthesis glycosyltransferase
VKRFLDIALSAVGVVVLLPVFAIVAIAIKLNSPGPVFFRQQRIGRRFQPFTIYKFRTMKVDAASTGRPISVGDDDRVTRVGGVLRRLKIDEFPQLFNVLKGDMSLVGPRPELKQFVEMYREAYTEILEARPGLTDPASIKYRNEAALLGGCEDPEAEYAQRILPDKIRLSREYVRRSSISMDLVLLLKTLFHIANNEAA